MSLTSSTTLVEWVQWQTGRHLWQRSRYHVRLNSGGALLCGRRAPIGAAADSLTAPVGERCVVCRRKLRELV